MKAKIIAILLSLSAITLPVQAANTHQTQDKPKIPPQVISSRKIDLNRADLATLTGSFKGVGKKRAEAIIAYRESHQGFKSLEELAEVKGFGQRFIEKNKEKLKEVFAVN